MDASTHGQRATRASRSNSCSPGGPQVRRPEALVLGIVTRRCDLGHIPAPTEGPELCVSGAGRTYKEGQGARLRPTDVGSSGRPQPGPEPQPSAVFTFHPRRPRGFLPLQRRSAPPPEPGDPPLCRARARAPPRPACAAPPPSARGPAHESGPARAPQL